LLVVYVGVLMMHGHKNIKLNRVHSKSN